ncbi:hypothetical protein CUMW_171590 [Citrus unshiu]|uniref:Histidine-containing phosphotransfer protein n=1 Tax=Citrus unshiu TaxID=55188 RepID=A0A2H5PWF6_CITUN|nr:hypothetical protein CUMW_171590 [Citrus unshiu]
MNNSSCWRSSKMMLTLILFEEVVTLHYRDSARLITTIERALEKSPLDFNKLDGYMHQFKGSSTSIGAKKVKAESTQFREYCEAGNGEG